MIQISEFFTSIQGEGSKAGTIMFFVRVQGCSVGCSFCDTKYSWQFHKSNLVSNEEIVKRALESYCDWVCITGGEPLEHDISSLIDDLKEAGLKVMIETSGYGKYDCMNADWIVLSPKDRFSDKKCSLDYFSELKCVVTSKDDVLYYTQKYKREDCYKSFQPVNNDGKIATMLINLKIPNWRITGQQHVLFGLR